MPRMFGVKHGNESTNRCRITSGLLEYPDGEAECGICQFDDVKRLKGIETVRPSMSKYPGHDGDAEAIGCVLDHVSNLADFET